MDDHFKGRSAAARSFKGNYLQMWDVLMREAAAAELLCDGHLLTKLKDLTVGLNWCAAGQGPAPGRRAGSPTLHGSLAWSMPDAAVCFCV